MALLALDAFVDSLASADGSDAAGELDELGRLGDQVAHRAYLPASPNRFGVLEPPLPRALERALRADGVAQLWSHQVEAIEAARAGRNVLLTTPTASGKSLAFQVPVLEEALRGGPGRALFLFPLKALGQDQRAKFSRLARACGLDEEAAGAAIYDGDTPRKERQRIREAPPRVLITNPDMLHLGILGHAPSWGHFFRDLRWIVLDELHTYRGIFGCHFYHVLQRLQRICRRHGAEPTVIASSATAENAQPFAEELCGLPFAAIGESGAPREGRHFLLFQPSTSPYTTSLQLLIACLESGLKTIVFTKARRITELLHSWLAQKEPRLAKRVANYRAGFLPAERRAIERRLFEGELDGVISTSALEMGIDIGGLDACILVGFPGSMMATWQRSGRVGREGRESLTALVALPDALDQYLLRNPEQFLARPCETLVVSPGNARIGRSHLLCAAAELPLRRQGDERYLERHAPLVGDLLGEFQLAESEDGREIYSVRPRPHREVSLRGSGATYRIQSTATGRAIGTVDGGRVQRECHPGAVYLHGGRQFAILELDAAKRRVLAEPVRVDWFTQPLTEKQTEILRVHRESSAGPLHAWLGDVKVTEWVVGFERRRIRSQERLGQEALDLEPVEMETLALWWAAPRAIEETLREHAEDFMGALHAAEHAAISLFPALALCDRNDLGGISIPFHPQVGSGAVFLYDGHEGGVGIAEAAFERLTELLDRVEELVAGCDCEDGCPACIQSPKCGNGNRPLDKAGAQRFVRLLRQREEPASGAAIERPTLDLDRPLAQIERRVQLEPETARPRAGDLRRSRDLFDLEASPGAAPPQELPPLPARPDSRSPAEAPLPARRESAARRRPPPRAPLPRIVRRTALFDVETKRSAEEVGGWHQLHRLGVAIGVVCFLEDGRIESYGEERVREMVDALRAADLVVGFNVLRFDYPVLSGYLGEDFRRTLPTLDLFEQVHEVVGERVGLARLCTETLGVTKSADGLQSLEWYRRGELDKIEAYCRVDVELLRDLYLFGRREGYVLYRKKDDETVLRVPVSW